MVDRVRVIALLSGIAIAMTLLSGCGSGNGNDPDTGSPGIDSAGDGLGTGLPAPDSIDNGGSVTTDATVDALQGNWLLCENLGTLSNSTSLLFSGDTFTLTRYRYQDADCTGAQTEIGRYTGVFTLGVPLTTASGVRATSIDLQLQDGDVDAQYPIHYDIVQIANDVLYRGDIATGSTLSKAMRPTDLSFSLAYRRQ